MSSSGSVLPLRYARSFGLAAMFLCLLSAGLAHAQATISAGAQALYTEGTTLMRTGRLAEAQRVLLRAEAAAPGSLEIKITLGKLDALLGKSDDAIRLFSEVESKDPANSENEVNLAIALATRGSLDEALISATKAVQSGPRSAAAHHIRGKILAALNLAGEAQTEYETTLALTPADPLTLYDYAQFCEGTGNLREEVSILQRLVAVRPDNAQDRFLLARTLSRTGDQEGARREYRETIRLEPDNRAALYSLSRALQKEDPVQAAQLWARFGSLRISDDELNAIRSQGNDGVSAMQNRDWPRAIAIFESALASCAGCTLEATLEKDLGLSQCQGGDTAAGMISLRRSLALNPKDLDTLRALEIAEQANAAAKH